MRKPIFKEKWHQNVATAGIIISVLFIIWQIFNPSDKPAPVISVGDKINASSDRGSQTIVATGESTVNIGIPFAEHEAALRRQEKRHQEEISKIKNAYKEELEKDFPDGHVVAGVSKEKFIPPEEVKIPGLSIDWPSVKIIDITSEKMTIRMPDFTYEDPSGRKGSVSGNTVTVPRVAGYRMNLMRVNNLGVLLKVIYSKGDLTIIVFGFSLETQP